MASIGKADRGLQSIDTIFHEGRNYGQLRGLRRCPGVGVTLYRLNMSAHEDLCSSYSEMSIGLCLTPTVPIRWKIGGQAGREENARAGNLLFVPPAVDIEMEVAADYERLIVTARPDALSALLQDQTPAALASLSRLVRPELLRLPEIRRSLMALWRATRDDDPVSMMLAESYWQTALALLLREAEVKTATRIRRLSQAQLKKIDAFARDRLSTRLKVTDLAALLELPPTQFSRDFKATTGQSPYQYVLDLRIEKPRSLMASSTRSLSDIAHDCGFASQSHMTDVFRARVGASPGQLRKTVT